MAVKLPSLFDDEEYLVPKQPKETKNNNTESIHPEKASLTKEEKASEAQEITPETPTKEAVSEQNTSVDSLEKLEAQQTIEAKESRTENITQEPLSEPNTERATNNTVAISEEEQLHSSTEEQLHSESLEDIIPVPSKEQAEQKTEVTNIEIPESKPAKNIISENIVFEFPDNDEDFEINTNTIDINKEEISITETSKDSTEDSLDYLYRQELILQDYTALMDIPEMVEEKKIDFSVEGEALDKEQDFTTQGNIPIPDAVAIEDIDFSFEEEASETAAPLPEFNLEDKYYTIGEVADLFNVNVSHIRFWTKEFDLSVRTTRKGDRLYNPENIVRLRLIHHLVKENGFTIKGAKEKLKVQKESVNVNIDLKENLVALKQKLETIKNNL